jgi:hypothetical protein
VPLRTAFATAIATLAAAAPASAAVGDVEYRDCLSGELNLAACTPVAGATADGTDSGLSNPAAVAVGVGGSSLYAASRGDAAVARFDRAVRGALSYRDCIGADSNAPCTLIPGAVIEGTGTGLQQAEDLAASPDGAHLYASSGPADAISRFAIGPGGELAYVGCVSANTAIAGCSKTPTATAAGSDSGMDNPEGLVLSPDGRFLYVVSASDGGIAWFARGPGGALAYRGCISADSDATACGQLPFAASEADETGFGSLREIAISPDGRSLYIVSDADEAIARFSLRADGSPRFRDCVTGQTTILPCEPIAGANPTGADTGLRSLVDVSVSPEGNSVYAVSDGDSALAHFSRDPGSGKLSFRGCQTGDSDVACTKVPAATSGNATDSGMEFPTVARVAADGRSVHLAATSDDALTSFDRNPRTGGLRFAGCISGQMIAACEPSAGATATGEDSGLDGVRPLAVGADGSAVYLGAQADSAVARFSREPDAAGPKLKLKARRKQRGRRIKAQVECRNEFCPLVRVSGKLVVKAEKRRTISLRAVRLRDLQAGATATVKLKLDKRSRRLVRRSGGAKVKLVARAGDLLDNRAAKLKRLGLRP